MNIKLYIRNAKISYELEIITAVKTSTEMKLTVNRFGKRVNILSASIFLKSQRIHVFRCQEDFSEVNSQIFE